MTVTASDAAGNTGNASFSWTVNNVAPTVVNHSYGAAKNTPLFVNAVLGVLSGSSDPGGETTQAVPDVLPTHGTLALNSDGSFTYTPTTGYFGPDSFTYHAYDGLNGGNVATVTLNVGDTTPPVVTNPGAQTSTEGNTVNLQIQSTDPDDVTFSYTATGLPLGLSIAPTTGLITGTVVSTFTQHGPYSVTVTASDAAGNTGIAAFAWTVNNLAPVVIDHAYSVRLNIPLIVNAVSGVLSGSSDPGWRPSRPLRTSFPSRHTGAQQQRFVHVYPALNYGGPDSFTFHGYDGLNGGNVATVTLQVADVTPPVVTNPGSQLNTEGDSVNLPIQASDPNGTVVTFSATGLPPGLGISPTSGADQRHGGFDVRPARPV